MSTQYTQNPDNALKRAKELCSIPTSDKSLAKKHKHAALEILHDTIARKFNKAWVPAHEEIMLKYIDICVELQLSRIIRDGLSQYRNLCQMTNPASIEHVVSHLISEAENRAKEAKLAADQCSLAAAVGVADLEAEQSPETILLSATTTEDHHDRSDYVVVLPWLRFLWETYRITLDVVRSTSKLEGLYHSTSSKAFKFCLEYSRKIEFHRLCEALRGHLSTFQKHMANPLGDTKWQLRGWEAWNSESIELHLQTRYEQLEAAVSLELWTEGFRTIEDIHLIMGIIPKQPKVSLMATYYEKLHQIFWVSENHLFHAYAWYKFYILSSKQNTKLTPEQLHVMAASVVLAALSIPIFDETNNLSVSYSYDITKEKNIRMATLLGFVSTPSRQHLMDQIVEQNIIANALPEIQSLYKVVENDNQPFPNSTIVQETLKFLRNHETLQVYVPAIEKLLIQRLVKKLSHIYRRVKMDYFRSLLVGLNVSFPQVEQLIVNCVQNGKIQVRIDHLQGCLHFHTLTVESDTMKKQLSNLARKLTVVVNKIHPETLEEEKKRGEEQRQVFYSARKHMIQEHQNTLQRKLIIEKRKEDTERLQKETLREEERKRQAFEQQRQEMEKARLEKEAALRANEKSEKLKHENALIQTKQLLDLLGQDTGKIDIEGLTQTDREKIIKESTEKAAKAKEDAIRKLRDQAKRLDHITRATREVEQPILARVYQEQVQKDQENAEARYQAKLESHRQNWKFALEEKKRLCRMEQHLKDFIKGRK